MTDDEPSDRAFVPAVLLKKGSVTITVRELEALAMLADTKSQNSAAARLGISVPVLHRRIKSIEAKAGTALVAATPADTRLTAAGTDLLYRYDAARVRMLQPEQTRIGCTPVAQRIVHAALDACGTDATTICTDAATLGRLLSTGALTLALFDDAQYMAGLDTALQAAQQPICLDSLVHRDHGAHYIHYYYGNQRIGFRWLEQQNIQHTIIRRTHSFEALDASGLSYFASASMCGADHDPRFFHALVVAGATEENSAFIETLRKRAPSYGFRPL